MPRLPITKEQESVTVARIWNMGAHSLDPESYMELERILIQLCDTRNIDREAVACEHINLSWKDVHASDCATSNSPAEVPGPCNCGNN